jgi:hypothetical protein
MAQSQRNGSGSSRSYDAVIVGAGFGAYRGWEDIHRKKCNGWTDEIFLFDEARMMYQKGGFVSSVLFFYLHGGLICMHMQSCCGGLTDTHPVW